MGMNRSCHPHDVLLIYVTSVSYMIYYTNSTETTSKDHHTSEDRKEVILCS